MPPDLNKQPQKNYYERQTPVRMSQDSKGGNKGKSIPPETLTE